MTKAQQKIDLKKMRTSADSACNLMKVLSNRNRLMLLCDISQGEKCVSDLELNLGIVQPTLSQQLTILRTQKLVKTRRSGKQIYYSLASPIAVAVMELLYQHYCKK